MCSCMKSKKQNSNAGVPQRLGLTRWGEISRHSTKESMQTKLKWLQVNANTAKQRRAPTTARRRRVRLAGPDVPGGLPPLAQRSRERAMVDA